MYNFKDEKTDFEKTENEIVQIILDNEPFSLPKTENDYMAAETQTVKEIRNETEQGNKHYLETVFDFSKVDLTTAKENLEKILTVF